MTRALAPAVLASGVFVVAVVWAALDRPLPWYVAGGGVLVGCWAVVAAALARSKALLVVAVLALLGCGALAVHGVVTRHPAPDDVFEGFGPAPHRPDAR